MEKPDPYHPSLPHVVTISGFQVLLISITYLPSYLPIGRRNLPYCSPHPVYMPHPISKWLTRPLSHSLYLGYKSGLKTPVQCQFSLELAHCSNSVSQSNKLYFPLILSHVWKFFSNCAQNTTPNSRVVMLVSDKRDLKYKKDYKIQRTWYIYMGFSEAKNVIIVNSYHLTTDHKIY